MAGTDDDDSDLLTPDFNRDLPWKEVLRGHPRPGVCEIGWLAQPEVCVYYRIFSLRGGAVNRLKPFPPVR